MNRPIARSQARALSAWLLAMALAATGLNAQDAAKPASDPPAPQRTGADSVGPESRGVDPKGPEKAALPGKPGVDRGSVLKLLFQANPMLWPLAACSIFTVGVALERLLALRRKRVVPPEFANRLVERLEAGKLDRERALELCRANESPASRAFASALKSWGLPGSAIRQNVSFDAAGEVIEMKRNLRLLSGMATLGPLLGLLGTVVGIIQSFDALGGRMGPSRGEALAQGISLALVATAFGLCIAIFAVVLYYFLLNRVDVLVRELDDRTRQVIDLISAESLRPGGMERRHAPLPPPDTLRQETRVF
ncbi:colicin uptake protein TolQ [Aquisphaera giovannonii]|uniref:Colicin uptake protein TolQ n=1 Tax=Aquisphaera giovannonii TaxID=406548 RepID=A0A5B9W9H4_9BACT|nr:MotA/TolQ/ExbB proton channel family protein [Aquisphaera giovannonii]QEH36914.1 colicin uptake protein TolQ [Aquisphaera giovannonii]